MKKSTFILIILIFFSVEAQTQELLWKANVYSFFDNLEFGQSKYKFSQTMSGIQAAPEIGIRFDSVHIISGGVNFLQEFGNEVIGNKIYPIIYYEFNKNQYRFLMGAFPEKAGYIRSEIRY
jgi:hypothetical protein